MPRTYQVSVVTTAGTNTIIMVARTGVAAISQAMAHFPDARTISAKPHTRYRADRAFFG